MSTRARLPINEMQRRYAAGESTRELAVVYGVHQVTVWRHLRAAGVRVRGHAGNKSHLGLHKRGGPLHARAGYLYTRDRVGGLCRVHRACYEACCGPIPDCHIVHHKDGDTTNNCPANLECMTQNRHVAFHNMKRVRR